MVSAKYLGLFTILLQSLGTVSALDPYIEFYSDNDCQQSQSVENQPYSGCYSMRTYPASAVKVFTNETCVFGIFTDPVCIDAIEIRAAGEPCCTPLPSTSDWHCYSQIICLPFDIRLEALLPTGF
jgi:hypothetical protein